MFPHSIPFPIRMNNLYKHTPLQSTFAMNMVALVDGVPRTLNLLQMLVAYVDHQIEVIRRRSQDRLDKAARRAHIVEGRIRALNVIDQIIALVRGSADRSAARDALQLEPFLFSERQAEDILTMQLGQLTRLSRVDLESEQATLVAVMAALEAILNDDTRLRSVIKEELLSVREEFATPRVATITFDPGDMAIEDLVDDKELVLTMTAAGYIKSVEAGAFRTQGRGGRGIAGGKLKDEDYVTKVLHTTAHAYLLFFSTRGRVYRLRAHELPERDRTARGLPLVNLLELQPGERIQAVIDTRDYETNRYLFFATRRGTVKKTRFTEYDSSLRRGIIALDLRDGDELVRVIPTNGNDDIVMVSRGGQAIRFNEDDVRPMGRGAAGVRGMKLREGDEVVSCDTVREGADLLIVTAAGFGKRTDLDAFRGQGRGGQGIRGIRTNAVKGDVVAALIVDDDIDVLIVNSGGVVIRTPVREISRQGRDATGVRVMNVGASETVAAVAPVLASEEGDEAAPGTASEAGVVLSGAEDGPIAEDGPAPEEV